jgi:hypothetical protein
MKLYYFPAVIAEEGSIAQLTFGTAQPVAAIL